MEDFQYQKSSSGFSFSLGQCLKPRRGQQHPQTATWPSSSASYLVCALPFSSSSIAIAKSLQSCLTLCNPIDGSPPGSLIPRILQARTLEWVAISFSNAWKRKVKVKSLSHVRLFWFYFISLFIYVLAKIALYSVTSHLLFYIICINSMMCFTFLHRINIY